MGAGHASPPTSESFYTARSPTGSAGSSEASQIPAKNFKTYKKMINKKLTVLDKDETKYHSDLLEGELKLIKEMLSDLKIDSIIAQADKEPDFLGIFGDTEDSINDWRIAMEIRIDELSSKSYIQNVS